MSADSSNSQSLELAQLYVTSAVELDAVLLSLRPLLRYPLLLSILQQTALTPELPESASDLNSTISLLH
jgi:hypothetical protein